ncbi:serine protease [Kaistia sp. 32K]|uniref:NfeD family protein n=1 Tax=Kaistia sp. 32K TaxID=2795690 RepID=UPI001936C56B|nr:nodulation protein NfeD [Kaistia sp. 32K]BCP53189.1 serine protease [Kaistia sp. 32K]
MKPARIALFAALVAAASIPLPVASQAPPPEAGNAPRVALAVDVDGAIGPATAREIKEGLAVAEARRAEVVILRLNTPGGLATSMREIIADLIASPVPVVGYVAPSGAHAASAGTYILYATHIAAMAPGTNIGAATPVELGTPIPGLPAGGPPNAPPPKTGGDVESAKATNDAVALIRSLAELRKRNADWGEKAVREAASLSADAALQAGAIDLVARDEADLLRRIDGRTVEVTGGAHRTLATGDIAIERYDPGWLIHLLAVITDPNIAVLLMLAGVYGLIFEFVSPGLIAPGTVGTICLLLGFYGLNLLPIDYTGLALMLLGLVFLAIEVFNPTVVLGLGGLVSFLLGSAMLLRVQAPGFTLSRPILWAVAILVFGLSALTGRALWRIRSRPALVGGEAMPGMTAEVIDWDGATGHVFAHGERWSARGTEALAPGESVEVVAIDGLDLSVRRKAGDEAEPDGERP